MANNFVLPFFATLSPISASLSKMQEQISSFQNSTLLQSQQDPRYSQLSRSSFVPSLRNLQTQLGDFLTSINEYGCWCYFDGKYGKGKGEPIDELDGFCKTLQHGYECIIFKFSEMCKNKF